MSVSPVTTIEQCLRRLRPAASRVLVADLWAARGFETTVEGELVVARRRATAITLYPVAHTIGAPSLPDRPVDVVVAPRGGRHAVAVAARDGARVLDATALAEMLWYAVDRETTRALCERHLGAPPERLSPPLGVQLRERLPAVGSRRASVRAVVAGVLLVGVLVSGGLSVGLAVEEFAPDTDTRDAFSVGEAPSRGTPAIDTAPMAVPLDTNESSGPPALVPGLYSDGRVDLEELVVAHERAVGDGSYTIWADRHGPRNGSSGGERVQWDVDIRIEGERYLVETSLVSRGDGYTMQTPLRTVYHDGGVWYVREADGLVEYRTESAWPATAVVSEPLELHRTLVTRYLSTPELRVDGEVRRGDELHYRVFGSGTPSGPAFAAVSDYTAIAVVDREGFVYDLKVGYRVVNGDDSHIVRFSVTYDDVGRTTVEPPVWYEPTAERREAGAG